MFNSICQGSPMSYGLQENKRVTALYRAGCCMVNGMCSWQYYMQTWCTSQGHESEVREVCRQRPLWMWWCRYSFGHVRLCGKHKEGQAESHGSSRSQRHDSLPVSFYSFNPSFFLIVAGPHLQYVSTAFSLYFPFK